MQLKNLFKSNLFLMFLSGLLLALPWYEGLPSYTIFFGFVPLFVSYYRLVEQKAGFWKIFGFVYLSFFTWNILATWWIYNATVIGAVLAVLITALLMTIVFSIYHFIHINTSKTIGAFAFITFWIAWEQFFHNSEITWPWLTLGNSLGNHPMVIQWYEYTGVLGGSLWILVVNFFILSQITAYRERVYGRIAWFFSDVLLFFTIPFALSLYIYFNHEEKGEKVNVLIVQPNIDPYNEKFSGLTNEQQMDIMLNLAEENIDSTIRYVVCPETAIDDRIWEHQLADNESVKRLKAFVDRHPGVMWITGLVSLKLYEPNEPVSHTARKLPYDERYYYDRYNSAIQVDTLFNLPIYHKSKLVVGVEMMPYPQYLKFLEKLSIDLGGITGSLGTQPDRGVFRSIDGKCGVGPIICYESVFGEYVAGYVQNGANLLFVITNDGWWGNTPGYRQHLSFSRIRAIEMRRSIARSANTGISAIINQRGEVIDSLGWWKRGVIKGSVYANNATTYYARHGDYIGNISAFMALLSLAYGISRFLMRRKKQESMSFS